MEMEMSNAQKPHETPPTMDGASPPANLNLLRSFITHEVLTYFYAGNRSDIVPHGIDGHRIASPIRVDASSCPVGDSHMVVTYEVRHNNILIRRR
jgi:hypothetical protein